MLVFTPPLPSSRSVSLSGKEAAEDPEAPRHCVPGCCRKSPIKTHLDTAHSSVTWSCTTRQLQEGHETALSSFCWGFWGPLRSQGHGPSEILGEDKCISGPALSCFVPCHAGQEGSSKCVNRVWKTWRQHRCQPSQVPPTAPEACTCGFELPNDGSFHSLLGHSRCAVF